MFPARLSLLSSSVSLFLGGHGGEATPVPIPNTEVKGPSGEGTAAIGRGRVARRQGFSSRAARIFAIRAAFFFRLRGRRVAGSQGRRFAGLQVCKFAGSQVGGVGPLPRNVRTGGRAVGEAFGDRPRRRSPPPRGGWRGAPGGALRASPAPRPSRTLTLRAFVRKDGRAVDASLPLKPFVLTSRLSPLTSHLSPFKTACDFA